MSASARAPVVVLAAALAIVCGPAAAVSGADPHLNIAHVAWTSSHGTCSLDGEIATVSGVPSAVKHRIDAAFARALDGQSEYTSSDSAAEREAACGFDRIIITTDWTRGRTRGRWLSARYHVRTSYQHEPRPADDYTAVTFDLVHGGMQVPTSGFYPAAHRQSFNSAIAAAAIARDPRAAVAIRKISQHLKIEASAILLTPHGIEVTGAFPSLAHTLVVTVPYAALAGIGTPGGPLDPATR